MRALPLLPACVFLILSTQAHADNHVFVVANQPDSYGIDQCLANGENCGIPAARAYCRLHEFTRAVAFHRIDRDEVTGAVPVADGESESSEYVAITCQR